MYHFISASKDATVYLQQPNQNTGLDGILEVSKTYYGGVKEVSRALLYFDVSNIYEFQLEEATLILKETESEEIPLEFAIEANPVSQSWQMGIGTRFDEISTMGVSWYFRDGKTPWSPITNHADWQSGSFVNQGGTFYSEISGSQSFEYKTVDIQMDITEIVYSWVNGIIPNDGIVVKHPLDTEKDDNDYGTLKFFSKETNTIYQPKLRLGWDDQEFFTGSLQEFGDYKIHVAFRNFKKEYRVNSNTKIDVVSRHKYPLKTFENEFSYQTVGYYLPETTYYEITDYHTDDIIIPFSEYSKVSCSPNGNYINLNFNNWETDRTYKIKIKSVINGNTHYFDDDYTFLLIR